MFFLSNNFLLFYFLTRKTKNKGTVSLLYKQYNRNCLILHSEEQLYVFFSTNCIYVFSYFTFDIFIPEKQKIKRKARGRRRRGKQKAKGKSTMSMKEGEFIDLDGEERDVSWLVLREDGPQLTFSL